MPNRDSKEYFVRRAERARALAEATTDPAIRSSHAEMAKGFEIRVEDAAGNATKLTG